MASSISYLPKFGRVLVKREFNEKTTGGIILPDAKRHAKCIGEIVALGETAGWVEVPGKGFIQTLHIGDKVVIGRHSGAWLDGTYKSDGDSDDATLFICQDADILAVINQGE